MTTTRVTLLARVRDSSNEDAWSEFYALYAPLLYRYARGHRLSVGDAEEIRDQCLALLSRKLRDFDYEPERGSFQAWLYRLAAGRIVDMRRAALARRAETGELLAVADPSPTPDELWERSWRHQYLLYALECVRERVSERDYRAFEMLLFDERTTAEVGESLGLNANQVYKAKSRVLAEVRDHVRRAGWPT